MSDTNSDTSDIKDAADNTDVQQIEKNLQHNKKTDEPEALTKAQKTPFIDEDTRTDK